MSGLNVLSQLREKIGTNGAVRAQTAGSNTVNVSGLPAGSAAAYAGADWNKFMTDYGPLIEKQMLSLNSTYMVDLAEKDAAMVPGLMAGAVDRAAQRRGGVTNTQRASLASTRALNTASNTADVLNNARIDQRTRNTDTALRLSGLGTDIYQMGLDNVRESEGLAAQRKVNNAAASQSYKQNLLGAGLTAAAMFAI